MELKEKVEKLCKEENLFTLAGAREKEKLQDIIETGNLENIGFLLWLNSETKLTPKSFTNNVKIKLS